MAMMDPIILEEVEKIEKEIVNRFEVFIFDMDGVIWRTSGAIPGVAETLSCLRRRNKHIFFVTNNSTQRSPQYVERLKRMGLGEYPASHIFCSSTAVGIYLKMMNFRAKVYVLGPEALKSELRELEDVELVEPKHSTFASLEEAGAIQTDEDIAAVVMGLDLEFSYTKAVYATAVLTNNPDSLFIATNYDEQLPSKNGVLPGAGSLVRVVETATRRKATIVGKPSDVMLRQIERICPDVSRRNMCVIGDNLKTDIAFGRSNGTGTVLVETGVHTRYNIPGFDEETGATIPDFVIPSASLLNVDRR